MKKNIFIFAVIAALLFSCKGNASAESSDDGGKKYGPVKKITVTGLLDQKAAKELSKKIDSFPDNFVEVDLSSCTYEPDKYGHTGGVLSIVFQNDENVRKVKLGKNVNIISYGLFSGCKNLVQVTLPNSVDYIGGEAFKNCSSLKSLVLPKHVEHPEINISVFSGCNALESVVLPENVTRLYDDNYNWPRVFTNLKTLSVKNYPFSICNSCTESNRVCFAEPGNEEYQHFDVATPSGKKSYKEFFDDCSAFSPKPVVLKNLRASSTLKDLYKVENLTDCSWKSWSEGEDGEGKGVFIEADFSEPTCIELLSIKNGYGDLSYFFENNRVKKLKITLDDDESSSKEFFLSDSPDFQLLWLKDFTKLYSKIRFTIEEIYPGTGKDNDTCLSEISVNNFFEKPYSEDDTTIEMFSQLYERYEEGVKKDEDGNLQIQVFDEEGEYWKYPSLRWSDEFYKGSDPGTGGGHSYERYAIYLMEDGRHLLIKFTEASYGIFQEYYPARPEIFVWENRRWTPVKNPGEEKNLGEAGKLLDFVVKNDIDYKFFAADDGIFIRPMINYQNFCCEFKYDDYKIQNYERTPFNQAALGTVESLTAIKDWKNISSDDYHETKNLLVLSAGFNPNPEMSQFLIDEGYPVNLSEPADEYGNRFYSPLEVCMAQFNNPDVKKVLLDNGAAYTGQILVDAMNAGNIALFKEYAPLVKDYKPVLENFRNYYVKAYADRYPSNYSKIAPYFEQLLSILKNCGCDLNQKYSEGESDYLNRNVMKDAIEFRNLDFVKLLVKYGYKIDLQSPEFVEEIVDGYKNGAEDRQSDIDERKKQMEMLEYALSLGAAINPPKGEKWYGVLQYMCHDHTINQSNVDMCRYLLAHGADVNLRDEEGKSAVDYLIYCNQNDFVYTEAFGDLLDLLAENGADLSGIDMHWVRYDSHEEVRNKLRKLKNLEK